jgi:hypothetical protein
MPITAPPPEWAKIKNKPTTIAGYGITDSLNSGQTWQNVTESRAQSTNYTNSTGKPITVAFSGQSSAGSGAVYVNSVTVFIGQGRSTYYNGLPVFFVVPPGGVYQITGWDSVTNWSEYR